MPQSSERCKFRRKWCNTHMLGPPSAHRCPERLAGIELGLRCVSISTNSSDEEARGRNRQNDASSDEKWCKTHILGPPSVHRCPERLAGSELRLRGASIYINLSVSGRGRFRQNDERFEEKKWCKTHMLRPCNSPDLSKETRRHHTQTSMPQYLHKLVSIWPN
mgnify:CR=1 FL=1